MRIISLSHMESIIEASLTASNAEEVHNLCSDLCQALGFDYFLYGSQFPTSFVNPEYVIISGRLVDALQLRRLHGNRSHSAALHNSCGAAEMGRNRARQTGTGILNEPLSSIYKMPRKNLRSPIDRKPLRAPYRSSSSLPS